MTTTIKKSVNKVPKNTEAGTVSMPIAEYNQLIKKIANFDNAVKLTTNNYTNSAGTRTDYLECLVDLAVIKDLILSKLTDDLIDLFDGVEVDWTYKVAEKTITIKETLKNLEVD